MPNDVIDNLVTTIQKATGLTTGQAKASVYWSAATYRLGDLDFLAMLNIEGAAGTGKSTLLEIIKELSYKPVEVGCDGISLAALRDKLMQARHGTIIAEEADKAASPSKAEGYFRARCSKGTANLEIKRETEKGWIQDPRSIFGASALHRREPFRDQAVQSRVIIIRTRHKEGTFIKTKIDDQTKEMVRNLAKNIDLKARPAIPGNIAGRVVDVWQPLLLIAQSVKDRDWLLWAWNEMELADSELRDGHSYEPGALVLARVVELLSEEPAGKFRKLKPQEQMQRIRVDDDIARYLQKNSLPYTNPWQISRILKNLGFEVQRIGGVNYLLPTLKSIMLAQQKIGYEDKVLTGLGQQQPLKGQV